MPGPCDSILVNSPVNVVMQKRESTFSESYMDWIKTATQQQIQEAQAAGVSVILPTDPPIPLSASITNQQYHDFQTALEAGKVIDLNATQVDTIVTKSVDPLIYKAWTDCNEQNGFGVLNYSTIHADGSFTVLVRYAPNSPADLPPKFTDLEVTGATVVNPPAEGSVVPFAGVIIVFRRHRAPDGSFPDATYTINTEKGTAQGEIPAVPPQVPFLGAVKIYPPVRSVAGSATNATCEVEPGYTLIGGGARVNYPPGTTSPAAGSPANMLTNAYTLNDGFVASSHDHLVVSNADLDVWAIAIQNLARDFDVVYHEADSNAANHPCVTAVLPPGYALLGGGARTNAAFQFLTASAPAGDDSWMASSKDHAGIANPTTVTAFVVGFRVRGGGPTIPVQFKSITTAVSQRPEGSCPVPDGCRLIGGGAVSNYGGGPGLLLTASFPDGKRVACARRRPY